MSAPDIKYAFEELRTKLSHLTQGTTMSDDTTLLPFDDDAQGGDPALPGELTPHAGVLGESFLYIGRGLTADEFDAYVAGYDFGPIPPDFVVLHHTAIPTMEQWTAGQDESNCYTYRKAKLGAIMHYYKDTKGWDRGPHLFIDDRYIWLFTPMNALGIHAASGNSCRVNGRLHYSVGIEVVGDYSRAPWPPNVAALVSRAVNALQKKLKTFQIDYKDAPINRPELHIGQVASHRDFNKPACPGAAITPAFYLAALRSSHTSAPLPSSPIVPYSPTSPLLGLPKATAAQAAAYILKHPTGEYTPFDVAEVIVPAYFAICAKEAGLDPVLLLAQMIHETGNLTSWWSQRGTPVAPRRNPAGIGVTGRKEATMPPSGVWQKGPDGKWWEGLGFATWSAAIRAHVGRMLAYAISETGGGVTQQQLIGDALKLRPLPASYRGAAPTIAGLNGRWAVPGTVYNLKLCEIANGIAAQSVDR
jgi:hypothetical protein